jgi:hypothetical protein
MLTQKVDYIQINNDWNADPVDPEIDLQIVGQDLVMDIFLNYFAFDKYSEGDKARITFTNCSRYSLNYCNDEGYYLGQYRTRPSELPWGEFYEIKGGMNRDLPEPVVDLSTNRDNKRHFVFFFKDETFECLADDYRVEFNNDKIE